MLVKSPPTYSVPPVIIRDRTMPFASGFQVVGIPVVTSNAAIWFRVCAPSILKCPPTYTVPPLTARAYTAEFGEKPLGLGSHVVARPVDAEIAARKLRDPPPMVVNLPPAYTVLPLVASARTCKSAFGSHAVASPLEASSAA